MCRVRDQLLRSSRRRWALVLKVWRGRRRCALWRRASSPAVQAPARWAGGLPGVAARRRFPRLSTRRSMRRDARCTDRASAGSTCRKTRAHRAGHRAGTRVEAANLARRIVRAEDFPQPRFADRATCRGRSHGESERVPSPQRCQWRRIGRCRQALRAG